MELKGKVIDVEGLIEYQEGSVVSMEVIKKELGTVTLFAFDDDKVKRAITYNWSAIKSIDF